MTAFTFDGANGTKLSTLMALEFGTDSLELNGTGQLKSIAGATIPLYYSEGAVESGEQRIAFDFGAQVGSNAIKVGVFTSVGAGNAIQGYYVWQQATHSVRVARYVSGSAPANIPNMTAVTIVGTANIEFRAVVNPNGLQTDLSIYQNGVLVTTQPDTNAARIGSGKCGLAYSAAPAATGPVLDNLTTNAAADATAPTITSAAALDLAHNMALSHTLTADEVVSWSKIGGADAALFGLAGDQLTLTAKDYGAPTDADANNSYIVQVRATDAAGNATDQTITVSVQAPAALTVASIMQRRGRRTLAARRARRHKTR